MAVDVIGSIRSARVIEVLARLVNLHRALLSMRRTMARSLSATRSSNASHRQTSPVPTEPSCGNERFEKAGQINGPTANSMISDLPQGIASPFGSEQPSRKLRIPTRSEPANPGYPAPSKSKHHAAYCSPACSAKTVHSTLACRRICIQDAYARSSHARRSLSSGVRKQDLENPANPFGASDSVGPSHEQACEPPVPA